MIATADIRSLKAAATALAALAVLVGCAAPKTSGDQPAGTDIPDLSSELDFGNYIAGRFAGLVRDQQAGSYYVQALQSDPDNPLLLSRAFTLLLIEGRFEEAEDMAVRLAELPYGSSTADLLLAISAFRDGDLSRARELANGMGGSGFESLIAPILKAWLAAEQGDRDEAIEALAPLGVIRGLKPFEDAHRAYILDYLGETVEAELAYEAAVGSDQLNSLQPVISYAAMLQRTGRADEALDLIDRFSEEFPGNEVLMRGREQLENGQALEPQTRQPKGAVSLALFRAASELGRDNARQPAIIYARMTTYLNPSLAKAQLMLGNMLVAEERIDAAIAAYRSIEPDDARNEEAQMRIALALDDDGREDAAIASLDRYLEDNPDSTRALITLGDLYRTKEKYAQAEKAYSRAIAKLDNPKKDAWFLYFTRGIAYEQTDRWDKAEADFHKALSLHPDQPQVLNYLGYSWLDRGENLEKAMEMVERAVEQRPNDGYIIDSLGWGHFMLGNYEKAIKYLEQAVLLQPSDPTINDHLGDAYWKVGREMEARFQWSHALDADPEPEVARRIREKLEYGPALAQVKPPE